MVFKNELLSSFKAENIIANGNIVQIAQIFISLGNYKCFLTSSSAMTIKSAFSYCLTGELKHLHWSR